jgi:Fe-S cluster assembly ATP-binding protein
MLEIKNLNVYNGELEIITQANFDVASKELILIEGENGSGKSSLIKAIFKYPGYEIKSGQIVLDDKNITELEVDDMAKLGFYFGMQHIPEIEGISTLSFLYKAYKNLNQSPVSVSDFKNKLIEDCKKFDLDTELLSRDLNVGFSGGQKKQADMMHILALNPKYIFLDEPDSGVDKNAVEKVYSVINHMRENGSAVVLVSHSKEAEKLNPSRVYKVDNGICKII